MKMSQFRNKAPFIIWIALIVFVVGFGGSAFIEWIVRVVSDEQNQVDQTGREIYTAIIDEEEIHRVEFNNELNYKINLYSQAGFNLLLEDYLDDIWELFQDKRTIKVEAESLNLVPSEKEGNDFLKNYPPIEFQTALKQNNLFIEKNSIYDFGETFTDCDDLDISFCSNDEGWTDSLGNNVYDEGEPFVDGSDTRNGIFDLNAYKNSFGSNWIPSKELEDFIRFYNDNLLDADGGNGLFTNLTRKKIKFIYDQIVYISENRVIEQINNNNTLCSIDLLIANYSDVPDSLVNISEKEIENYYNKNKQDFKIEENISVEYVMFEKINNSQDNEGLNALQQNNSIDFSNYAKIEGFNAALTKYPHMLGISKDSSDNSLVPYEDKYFINNKIDENISEYKVLRPLYSNTINVLEGLDRTKSGFPTGVNHNRQMIRFVFDNINSDMQVSDSYETTAGYVIINIKELKEESYTPISKVRDEIRNILINNKKYDMVENEINDMLNSDKSLDEMSFENNYINVYNNLEGTTLSNFTSLKPYDIGINYEISGCLNIMDDGDVSYIIESNNDRNLNQLYVVELNNKTISVTDSLISEKEQSTRNTLFNQRSSGVYNSWLVYNRDQQEVTDLRHKIY